MPHHVLTPLLERSGQLDASVWSALPESYELAADTARSQSSLTAALIAVEQARACRLLISEGMHTTAIGVNRVQFEALCRCMWLFYAATDEEVSTLTAELTVEAEKEANKLPMAAEMVKRLEGKAPVNALAIMTGYRDAMLKQLHSFLHVGLHPLKRHVGGYPLQLVTQVVYNANGLLIATGAMLAILAGSSRAMVRMNELQREFADCTPALIVRPTNA